MREAKLKLEEARRREAVEDQEKALAELRQAEAELEKILRQLREEELERMLAMLEARFRKMLELQLQVYEGTLIIDQIPPEARGRDDEIAAGRLSRQESIIYNEADKALELLREEGSAVAFPEAVQQMQEDMDQVVVLLAQAAVGEITQGLEEDIIEALEEMIAALEKAQQELEEQQSQPPPAEGQPQEPPLIDQLAELKMIRSLQLRVNKRTQRYAKLVDGEVGQTDRPDLLRQLRLLSDKEDRIFQVTRDIVLGRNQ